MLCFLWYGLPMFLDCSSASGSFIFLSCLSITPWLPLLCLFRLLPTWAPLLPDFQFRPTVVPWYKYWAMLPILNLSRNVSSFTCEEIFCFGGGVEFFIWLFLNSSIIFYPYYVGIRYEKNQHLEVITTKVSVQHSPNTKMHQLSQCI